MISLARIVTESDYESDEEDIYLATKYNSHQDNMPLWNDVEEIEFYWDYSVEE